MKKQITYLAIALLSTGLFFTSCKKEKATDDTTTEVKVLADDQERFSNENDAATSDANAALENLGGSYVGDTPLTPQLPFACDATVSVDTASTPRKITITYNGSNCLGNRTRTGSIIISFAPNFRWVTAGSFYTVTMVNFKITRVSDGKSIVFNGEKKITNVSGGKLRNLATRTTPIVHEITSAGMTVTFDNGTQRSWQIAKRRTYTYDNGIVFAVTGIAAQGGGIAEWGINRSNYSFTNAILEPMTVKQSCNFRLVSGKAQHISNGRTVTATYGLDAAGVPVTSCPTGPFYYKVVWTNAAGLSYTVIAPY